MLTNVIVKKNQHQLYSLFHKHNLDGSANYLDMWLKMELKTANTLPLTQPDVNLWYIESIQV